jgi:hypothetical protein
MNHGRRLLASMLLVLGLAPGTHAEPALSVGQMWTFRNAPSEKTRLVIGRIEADTIHVSILFIPRPPDYPWDVPEITSGHMPFHRTAINNSIVQMVGKHDVPPAFQEGYAEWKAANGGVFSITVGEAIEIVLGTVSNAKQQNEH